MSRALRIVVIGLVAMGFAAYSALESHGQSRGKTPATTKAPATKANPATKPGTIQPIQATDQDVEAPPPRPRTKAAAGPAQEAQPPAANRGGARQPAADAPPRERLPRPDSPPPELYVQKLDPALEKILTDWETYSSRFQRLAGAFARRKYDPVFAVEFWSDGKFVYESPDKGCYQLDGVTPAKPKPGAAVKKTPQGVPYQRKTDRSEKWVCDGVNVTRIDDQEKTYERVEIPQEQRGKNIIDGPLPFLFGMKAQQAKLRYILELLEPASQFPEDFQIHVLPRRRDDQASWTEARVILDSERFVPKAVILTHPGGSETVHIFREIEINKTNKFKELFTGDPFKPNLASYKQVLNQAAAELPDDSRMPPTSAAPARTGAAAAPRGGQPPTNTAAGARRSGTQNK